MPPGRNPGMASRPPSPPAYTCLRCHAVFDGSLLVPPTFRPRPNRRLPTFILTLIITTRRPPGDRGPTSIMAAPAVDFNPTRQGKFKVLIGDSLKPGADDASQSSNVYSSFRYNTTPPEGLSKLIRSDNGNYTLSYDDDKDTSYSGAQRPGRKLECLLVYNPKDNTFTLERMSSVFTFNQSHPTSDTAAIPTATYDEEALANGSGNGNGTDDEEAPLADAENPFDVRHFATRVLPNSDEDDEEKDDQEHKDEDTDVDMDDADAHATMDHEHEPQESATTPGAVPSSSTPIPVSSATATPNPARPQAKRKPKKPAAVFMKPTKAKAQQAAAAAAKSPLLHPGTANDRHKEASMSPQPRLPSPLNPPVHSRNVQESSESDVDSSDEDDDRDRGGRRGQPPVNKHIQSLGMSREPSFTGSILSNNPPDELEFPDPKSEGKADAEEDDDFNLEEAMEEFDFMNDDEEESGGGGGGGDLTIEGEDEGGRGIGLGISNSRNINSATGAPMSLSMMTGGSRRLDDSEEESSEEE
ncbi:hypothetical protein Dda_7980 [Drechslerella dactyloides]|uniref:Transcription elongation factor Eaf N-terminal domain-containing protein n=1 Tax=Drechslerella dactyloides TaxID=74499 RepID=A0AAD6NG42_DREDA|nr:hypothetical protein Dda_7980 [Drechslerella dactyloides]